MTDKELYEKCLIIGRNARRWKNEFISLLPEVAKRQIHKKHGFATITEFAAKIGGVSGYVVERVFQVEKHIADKPALKKLISEVGINKVRVIATLATKENQEDLAQKVKTMSKEALELFAKEQKAPEIRPGTERSTISFSLDRDIEFKLRKFKNDLGNAVEWNDVIKALLEKAEKPKKKVRKTKPPKKINRYVPISIRLKLPEKCEFPGCEKPAKVIHHPERFSILPNHNNLKPLCRGHHELVHNGFEPEGWMPKTHPSIEQKALKCRSGKTTTSPEVLPTRLFWL